MNLSLFLSRRIYSNQDYRHQVSRPAVRIATIGVAIGLAVMIVTVSVVLGFKHTIRDKVAGFGSHIQVVNVQSSERPICIDDGTLHTYQSVEGVRHAERFATTRCILKTDDDFLGVMLKGIAQEYDTTFLSSCITDGQLPLFSDSSTQYQLVVSKTIADKLRLSTGDRIFAYFIGDDNVRARRFTVSGIYQTNMKRFDDLICITDLYAVQRLNQWDSLQCSGAELLLSDLDQLAAVDQRVLQTLHGNPDCDGQFSVPYTIHELYPQLFSWLELLDINVWIILGLMIAVAGFTMISGLLIIILERTQMIGLLKALGARNSTIRHTFLWFATFIIGRGLLCGNLTGIGLVLLQQYTGIIKLDAQTYYVSEAPMELSIPLVLVLNCSTLLISVLVLIIPSYLVSYIHPARSMHYE